MSGKGDHHVGAKSIPFDETIPLQNSLALQGQGAASVFRWKDLRLCNQRSMLQVLHCTCMPMLELADVRHSAVSAYHVRLPQSCIYNGKHGCHLISAKSKVMSLIYPLLVLLRKSILSMA